MAHNGLSQDENQSNSGMNPEDQSMFVMTADGNIQKPERLNSDYVDAVVLSFVLLVGVPLNLIALFRLRQQYLAAKAGNRSGQDETRIGFLMLKIQLTVVDLILLILYIPPKLLWLYFYDWPFGSFFCKLVVYLWMFSNHLMSFAVMIIAIDRAKTVYDLMRMKLKGRLPPANFKIRCIKVMIILTYIFSLTYSLPQWFVWDSYDFGGWSQCTTLWQAKRAVYYRTQSQRNATQDETQDVEWTDGFEWETFYIVFHLLTMFWIPFTIVLVCYGCIGFSLCFYSSPTSTNNGMKRERRDCEERAHMLLAENSTKADDTQTDCDKGKGTSFSKARCKTTPTWQTTMRSRLCHTSAQVILAYLVCWLPYNLLQISVYINTNLGIFLSVRFDSVFKLFLLFNTLLNPFIYGFQLNAFCSSCSRRRVKECMLDSCLRHPQTPC